jgi:hypothetical protein
MLELKKGLILIEASILDPVRKKSASFEILVAVSKEYHDFAFLFEASVINKLLKYKLWNHTIPLIEGKTSPYKLIYTLFEIKL